MYHHPAERDGSFAVWDEKAGGGAYGRLTLTETSQPCAETGLEGLTRGVSRPVPHTEEHRFAIPGGGRYVGARSMSCFC